MNRFTDPRSAAGDLPSFRGAPNPATAGAAPHEDATLEGAMAAEHDDELDNDYYEECAVVEGHLEDKVVEAYEEGFDDAEAPAPHAVGRRRRSASTRAPVDGAATLALGLLVTALGAALMFVSARAEALAATHVPAQLAVTIGVVLFALGLSHRKVGKMQQRMEQIEQQRESRDEQLQAAMEDLLHHVSHDEDRATDGPELQQALLALQRQDQKINNLTKATKMYGKPLMEIAAQCAELVGGLGQLREQVERSESASRDVDLGDVPAQLAALAEATSTLRSEASAERAELKAALEQGGDDQLQVRLAEATTRIGDGIDQLRTQELSGLESTLRDVQREVSSLATSVAQLQASARTGDQASSRPAAATATPAPAPAQPTTGDAATSKSSGYSTGARKSGGKNVLGAIAKLKQMKG